MNSSGKPEAGEPNHGTKAQDANLEQAIRAHQM